MLTEDQVGWWSDTGWVNDEYDELYYKQQSVVDPRARKEILWRMQEIVYEESPYITLTYPEWLEAYNDTQWTGWVRAPEGIGPVIYTEYNIDSYLFAEPVAAGEEQGSSNATLIAAIVAVAAAVVVLALVVWSRGRGKAEEA